MPAVTPETAIVRSTLAPHKILNNDTLVLSLESGDYFSLNETALFLWEQIANPIRIDALAQRLADEYGIEYSNALSDVTDFVTEILECSIGKAVPKAEV